MFRRCKGDREPDTVEVTQSPSVDAAEAWRAVGLVNDWVRHAEAKSAATLAASGVAGGLLYNLIKGQTHPGLTIAIAAPVCAVGVVAGATCAVVALWPRLRAKDEPTSALYFDHIARRHPKGPDGYIAELKTLVLSQEELLTQLAQQVWANARVARHKYVWAARGLVALFGAALALGVVAARLALASVGVS